MDEGTLLEWLVAPGDLVHKGDIVAVVDTAKAAVEVESFAEGVVESLLVEPGTTVAVGTVLATLGNTGIPGAATAPEPSPTPSPPPSAERTRAAPEVHSPLVRRLAGELGVDLAEVPGTGRGGTITRKDVTRAAGRPSPSRLAAAAPTETAHAQAAGRVTPYARRLAAELGIDLATVHGRDGGPIRAADIRAAAEAGVQPAQKAAPAEKMRAQIAAVMSRAKREIPHYYLSTTVDLGRAMEWMHERNLTRPVTERLVPSALLLKATALAAAGAPEFNGFWIEDRFEPGSGVHLGIAVSLRGGGLVAPALHDAADLTLDQVMAGMRDLVSRARNGRLRGSELSDPTITVTNLGDQGVESVYGIIYPPQVALVGFGRVVERPWAVDGLLGVRPVTTVTLSADHRATDGFTGGRLLAAIDHHLQQPEEL